jgi:hypothetical protein
VIHFLPWFLGALVVGVILINSCEDWFEMAGFLVIVAGFAVGVHSCSGSPEYAEEQATKAAKAAADEQPRVIREVDGCKVYAFHSGDRWHYFTRCPTSTTTESSWTESCGKNCRTTKTETIEVKK